MLKNCVLYSKGHYEKSNDLIEDLKKCLKADDYSPFDKGDVKGVLLNFVSQQPYMLRNGISYYTDNLLEAINPKYCWKIGYYTIEHKEICYNAGKEFLESLKPYDFDTAIIHYCLSSMRYWEKDIFGDLGEANPKVLPLKKNKF